MPVSIDIVITCFLEKPHKYATSAAKPNPFKFFCIYKSTFISINKNGSPNQGIKAANHCLNLIKLKM